MIYVLPHTNTKSRSIQINTHTVTILQRHPGKPTHSCAKTIRLPHG